MKNIVILGGGSAGWMTALFLKKTWDNINITVVEDPNTPPIIAGESGSFVVNSMLEYLDINIMDWIKHSNATPKLGGKFNEWKSKDTFFFHTLINQGVLATFKRRNNLTEDTKIDHIALLNNDPICKLYAAGWFAERNNSTYLKNDPTGILFDAPMLHFDSRATADFLKSIGISRGINLMEKRYVKSTIDADHGTIRSIIFDDATGIDGDWFFDCSGFARLLLKKTLDAKFYDYSHIFPACNVVAWWDKPEDKVYTELTAMDYGWSWNINLNHRSGNGYIYDGDEITVDQAIAEAEQRFKTKIDPVAKLKFTPETTKEFWKGNVIGIGLSAGFVEPMEANGLGIVIDNLLVLQKYWNPLIECECEERYNYNKAAFNAMEDIIDFICLHYRGKRTDTNYWIKLKEEYRITDNIKHKMELWKEGILTNDPSAREQYPYESYLTVAQALDLIDLEKLRNNQKYTSEILHNYNKMKQQMNVEMHKLQNEVLHVTEWKNKIYGTNS